MSNTSATGGYLVPLNTVDEDNTLRRFLHDIIAGVTGLDNTLVRPGFQRNSPNMPAADVDWVSFYELTRGTINNPQLKYKDAETFTLDKVERLTYLCSFFGDNCQLNAYNYRDGLYVPQNREVMLVNGYVLYEVSDGTYLPELVNGTYIQRTDIRFSFDRVVHREYAILTLLTMQAQVAVETSGDELVVFEAEAGG